MCCCCFLRMQWNRFGELEWDRWRTFVKKFPFFFKSALHMCLLWLEDLQNFQWTYTWKVTQVTRLLQQRHGHVLGCVSRSVPRTKQLPPWYDLLVPLTSTPPAGAPPVGLIKSTKHYESRPGSENFAEIAVGVGTQIKSFTLYKFSAQSTYDDCRLHVPDRYEFKHQKNIKSANFSKIRGC